MWEAVFIEIISEENIQKLWLQILKWQGRETIEARASLFQNNVTLGTSTHRLVTGF